MGSRARTGELPAEEFELIRHDAIDGETGPSPEESGRWVWLTSRGRMCTLERGEDVSDFCPPAIAAKLRQ